MEVSLQVSGEAPEVLLSPVEYGLDGDPKHELLPYKSDRPLKYMAKYGIHLPGKLVTKADGISKCPGCGQIYAGKHGQCMKPVTWLQTYDRHWSHRRRTHDWHGADEHIYSAVEGPCEGWCTWSLESEFLYQVRFFDLMEEMPEHDAVVAVGAATDYGYVAANGVPLILAQQLMLLQLKSENAMLVDQMRKQNEMLNEIASKMDMAGRCLSF